MWQSLSWEWLKVRFCCNTMADLRQKWGCDVSHLNMSHHRKTPVLQVRACSILNGRLQLQWENGFWSFQTPNSFFHIQRDLIKGLVKGNQCYNAICPLSEGARTDLDWWAHHLAKWNGKSLLLRKTDLTIESNASLTRWEATSQDVRTGSPWSPSKRTWHINCLELLAATLAVQTFLKGQTNKHVLLYLDNTTAAAYINNLGRTVSLQATTLARHLWMWCLEKDIILSAQHLPGKQNVRWSDWMLCPRIFQKIQVTMGPMEVDLFASWLTNQLPRFFSWRPDPLAEATDAFLQDWTI